MLPNWFVNNFSINRLTECIDTKRWLVANIIAIVCLAMTSICSISSKQSLSRLMTCNGFDLFGEFTNKVANLAISCLMIQHLMCQLINYQTYRSSNYQTLVLTQPIRAVGDSTKLDKVLMLVTMSLFLVYGSLSIISTYTTHGLIWWLMMYKITIGIFYAFAATKAFKILIANCLSLDLTCQTLLREISKLYLELIKDGLRGKSKQLCVTELCV